MNAVQTLIRRTAAALSAIAALTVPGLATAQVVTLTGTSGSSCTYQQMTVLPNGNVSVVCLSTSSPGVFTLTAPTSLSTNSSSTSSQVRINRAGTLGAVTVAFTVTGACSSATTTPAAFADGDSTYSIIVDTGASSGTCTVALQTPTGGATIGSPSSKSFPVVDPDAPVTFAFATTSSAASVGSSSVQVVVTRTGGSNNTWTVPVTASGALTIGGSVPITSGGTLPVMPATLTFPAGSSASQTFTYTPPAVTPGSPALPATVQFQLGAPNSTPTPPTQTGTVASPSTHTVTLNGPAVGCPVPETVAASADAAFANGTTLVMPSGGIKTFTLPAPTLGHVTGNWRMSAGTSTMVSIAPFYFEVHINKCKGLVDGTLGDTCYGKFSTNTGVWGKVWFTQTIPNNTAYDTVAEIRGRNYCYAPAAEGPWYVNIRYIYSNCTIGTCGWNYQWQNWSY